MGNEQSQESAAQPEPDAEEHFDLSDIPDDREVSPGPGANMANTSPRKSSPSANTPHVKKRIRKRKRKSSSTATHLAPTEVVPEEVKALREKASQEDNRSLREREPETYHIYATSDDSDGEEAETGARASPPKAWATVNSTIAEEGLDKRTSQPAGIADVAVAVSQVPEDTQQEGENAVADAEAHGGLAAAAMNDAVPDPRVTKEGRFRCPFAEDHGCKMTFARRKAAVRHGSIHTSNFACSVCGKQLSRRDTLEAHLRKHTALEIASAEAGDKDITKPGQEQENAQEKEKAARDVTPVPNEADELQEESSPEFVTPLETSQPQAAAEQDELEEHSEPLTEDEANFDAAADDGQNGDAAQGPSEDHSPSPPSVFDEDDATIVKETPMLKGGLKRKRHAENASDSPRQSPEKSRKRAKKSSPSPPTSVQSKESEMSDAREETHGLLTRQNTEKIVPTLQKSRQGSIDGWAQKYTPGSKLRHPVFNPESPVARSAQGVEVIIPRTSQGGLSSAKSLPLESERAVSDNELNTDQLESLGLKKTKARKATYSTPKGKKRAESGVDYSTPARDQANQSDDASDGHESEPTNLATSVAKRTFAAMPSNKRPRERDEESASDFAEESGHESEAERTTKTERTKRSSKKYTEECPRCHRTFTNVASLRKHLKQPSAHSHLYSCHNCSEQFWSTTALARHETDTGHGKGNGMQGQTGFFSEWEVRKLHNWRDLFCEDHNITHDQFNEMMTDSMQRKTKDQWKWPFIGKSEFLKEYCAVLPHRNKRSMLRYRERNFQNLGGYRDWSAQDDKELVRLHKELGPKWSEIARRLTRTVDAVSQRWRHKLQVADAERGEWSRAEDNKFRKVLEQVRRESGTTAELDEWRIPWNKVSEKMGTRTGQQCSNHWRALHGIKRQGRWVKVEGLERTPGSSRILTPSKMEQRLNGEFTSPNGRRVLSEKFVQEDEEDEDEEKSPEQEVASEEKDEPQENGDGESEKEEEEEPEATQANTARRTTRRNPLAEITPGKTLGSSQLFAQTQANTSALKASQRDRQQPEDGVDDRPSPNIPIQRRVMSSRSPLQEIKVKDNGELDLGDRSNDGTDESEDGEANEDDDEPESLSEGSEADEEDAKANDIAVKDEADDSDASEQPEGPEADEEDESGLENGEEDDENDDDSSDESDDTDTSSETTDRKPNGHGNGNRNGQLKGRGKSTSNDFMDSINESARRTRGGGWLSRFVGGSSSQGQSQLKQMKRSKDESEDEDEETE